jgi:hypothetical protein
MNVGLETRPRSFLFWEYINQIFGTVQALIMLIFIESHRFICYFRRLPPVYDPREGAVILQSHRVVHTYIIKNK